MYFFRYFSLQVIIRQPILNIAPVPYCRSLLFILYMVECIR